MARWLLSMASVASVAVAEHGFLGAGGEALERRTFPALLPHQFQALPAALQPGFHQLQQEFQQPREPRRQAGHRRPGFRHQKTGFRQTKKKFAQLQKQKGTTQKQLQPFKPSFKQTRPSGAILEDSGFVEVVEFQPVRSAGFQPSPALAQAAFHPIHGVQEREEQGEQRELYFPIQIEEQGGQGGNYYPVQEEEEEHSGSGEELGEQAGSGETTSRNHSSLKRCRGGGGGGGG